MMIRLACPRHLNQNIQQLVLSRTLQASADKCDKKDKNDKRDKQGERKTSRQNMNQLIEKLDAEKTESTPIGMFRNIIELLDSKGAIVKTDSELPMDKKEKTGRKRKKKNIPQAKFEVKENSDVSDQTDTLGDISDDKFSLSEFVGKDVAPETGLDIVVKEADEIGVTNSQSTKVDSKEKVVEGNTSRLDQLKVHIKKSNSNHKGLKLMSHLLGETDVDHPHAAKKFVKTSDKIGIDPSGKNIAKNKSAIKTVDTVDGKNIQRDFDRILSRSRNASHGKDNQKDGQKWKMSKADTNGIRWTTSVERLAQRLAPLDLIEGPRTELFTDLNSSNASDEVLTGTVCSPFPIRAPHPSSVKETKDKMTLYQIRKNEDLHKLNCKIKPEPTNKWEVMMLHIDKQWKFPIDNQQDIGIEGQVGFEKHVFLEDYLNEFPNHMQIQKFMELVIHGLQDNPYLTAQEKKKRILWYRKYFENFTEEDLAVL